MTSLDDTMGAAPVAVAALEHDASVGRDMPAVDFQREVYAVLGLPVDAIDMGGAVAKLRRAALTNTPCMVSTPNLNFAVNALTDAAFRHSVVTSDLSLADGMPLVWVARLLGLPIRQRVSGAGVFEALAAHAPPAVTVFFFGGPDGAAHAACQRVNATASGLRCVGFAAPGFGTLQQMSAEAYIERINASGAQFVVAALGAQKGQAWLQRNRTRLVAPVRCHLGAVVNFAAGTVRRAPALLQHAGLEWLWRIAEEPALWKRYALDGLVFLRLLLLDVLPLAWSMRRSRASAEALQEAGVATAVAGDVCTLSLTGAWTQSNLQPLRTALTKGAASARRLRLVLYDVSHVDSAFIGLLMLAPRAFPLGMEIVGAQPALVRRLRRHRADHLLAPAGGAHA